MSLRVKHLKTLVGYISSYDALILNFFIDVIIL